MATCELMVERSVVAPAREVRGALVAQLDDLGYTMSTDQLTLIMARRGSAFKMMRRGAIEVPLEATAHLHLADRTTALTLRVHDRMSRPPQPDPALAAFFQQHCADLLRGLDTGLARLDPVAAQAFPAPRVTLPPPPAPGTAAAVAPPSARVAPRAGSGTGAIRQMMFSVPAEVAVVSADRLSEMLAVALLVTANPGAMPANLVDDVERFVARIERTLTAPAGESPVVELSAVERRVLDFLQEQVLIREELPVRTLHTCRTCKLERIVNPDYQRLVKRNEWIRTIGGGIGGSISRSGISPFVVVGTLFRLVPLDPDFVCNRCQGTSAQERIVTFCPSCGDLLKDAVLRTCSRCRHDLRGEARPERLWVSTATPDERTRPLALVGGGTAALGPAGGKLCAVCGGEFTTLWRILVEADSGWRELFVCGQTARCTPPSMVPPQPV